MPQSQDKTLNRISALLSRYGFDLNGVPIAQLIKEWSADYSVYWIRLSIIEALYQGRYKAISIEQILRLWQRRGQATYHFSYDFERLITEKLVINDLSKELTETQNFSEKSTDQQKKTDHSIPRFIPNLDSSQFYQKLRAVAYQKLTEELEFLSTK